MEMNERNQSAKFGVFRIGDALKNVEIELSYRTYKEKLFVVHGHCAPCVPT